MRARSFKQLYLACLIWLVASEASAGWYQQAQSVMGTRIEVELWSDSAQQANRLMQDVMEEMRRIDARMSTYKKDSELSRLNRNAANNWVQVDEELFGLIDFALSMSDETGGAFDITYASVGRYYNYRNRYRPDQKTIDGLLDRINYKNVELDRKGRRIRYTARATYVDLGGIAKGFAVDRCIAYLQKAGIRHAIVTAGGDSRILGDRRGRPWFLGIRHPRSDKDVIARMPVVNEAVSTSGDYERFFEENGVRYHHILNPKTGDSAREVSSVTVIGKEAVRTDALSTGLFVLGTEKAMKLIETIKGYEAVIVDTSGRMFYSSGFGKVSKR